MLNPDIFCYGNGVDPESTVFTRLVNVRTLVFGVFLFNSIPTFKNGVDLDQLASSILSSFM